MLILFQPGPHSAVTVPSAMSLIMKSCPWRDWEDEVAFQSLRPVHWWRSSTLHFVDAPVS